MTNQDRADRVRRAIQTEYANFPGRTVEEDITDILTDIRHLCDLTGWDFGGCLAMAEDHYEAERDEEAAS